MKRTHYLDLIRLHFRIHSVCAILGARQVGKTTLARQFAVQSDLQVIFFDLEDPVSLLALDNPIISKM